MQKERMLSDAGLLQKGAEYVVDAAGAFRLEVTPGQFVEIHGEMSSDVRERFLDEIAEIKKELRDIPIEDIISSHPELAEHVEAIPLGLEDVPISLIRMRGVPSFAIAVWSKSKIRSATRGGVLLQVPDARLPAGIPHIAGFQAICACCQSEVHGLQSPFQAHMPEFSRGNVPFERAVELYNGAMKEWRTTDDGQRDAEWHNEKKRAYRDAIQRVSTEHGIKFLGMRKGEDTWIKNYGALEGVEMMEITEIDAVQGKMRALRIGAALPEEVQGFSVDSGTLI